MIGPRWSKAWRDVFGRPARSVLAVLAMSAGIFQIGMMLYTWTVLQPALGGMYARTRPAAATLVVDRVDDALVEAVRRVPGVGDAEARPVVLARVRIGADEWVPAMLQVVRDFDRQRLDTFDPNDGAWPPVRDAVLLERTALRVARAGVGDSLVVRTSGADDRTLRLSGTVHAAGIPPAWMEHMVTGFIPWDSPLRRHPD